MVRRIGDTRERPVDVRLIASTNRDLRKITRAGRFRSDLFYRISMVSIHVPPLRERRDDIPLLVAHYNDRLASQMESRRSSLPPKRWRRSRPTGPGKCGS